MRLLPKDKDLSYLPYLWLIYLTFMIPYALFSGAGPKVWVSTVVAVMLFLPLYFLGYWVKGKQLLLVIAAIALLGVVFSPINPGSSVFFIYAGAYAGRFKKLRDSLGIIGTLLLAIALETLVFRLPAFFWAPAALFTVIIGAVNIHYAERSRENARLRMAQEEVARMAQIAERERISRDLHDVLGHTLSLIVLKSELASKLTDSDPQRAAEEIREVERISRDALTQVRSTVRGYQSRSLLAEVEQARTALQAAGVEVECDFNSPRIPAAQEGVLALALREAVTNVIRHARATCCRMSLRQDNDGGACHLEIVDNGCGQFGPEGVGLSGMRTRVEALGGSLRREVAAGTRLVITLPVRTG